MLEAPTKPHMLYDFLLMFVCCLKIEFGADLPRGMAVFAFQLSPLLKRLWKNIACHGFQKQGFCVGGPCQTVLRRCLHSSMCHMNGIIEIKSGFLGPDQKKHWVFGFVKFAPLCSKSCFFIFWPFKIQHDRYGSFEGTSHAEWPFLKSNYFAKR